MGSDGSVISLRMVGFHRTSDRPVLEGLDLDLGPAERLGVTGPNGSGKTTLLHVIVGLLKPQRGEVEVFGRVRRTEDDFREVRARVGLLFQEPEDQLFCPTVAEDVAFGPLNLGRTPAEAMEITRSTLDALGLAGLEDRVTYRLSFGEKRLVSLATVLAMQPEVLLLDEPTAGLDRQVWERIVRVLGALRVPMIIVSHDFELLDRLATRCARLCDGRLTDSRD